MCAARAVAKEHRQSSEWRAAGTSPGQAFQRPRNILGAARPIGNAAFATMRSGCLRTIVELHTYNCRPTRHRPTSMRMAFVAELHMYNRPGPDPTGNAIVEECHNRSDTTRHPPGRLKKTSLISAATGRRRKSRLEASRSKVARLLAVPGIAVFRFALMIESACSPDRRYNGEADGYANAFVAELHVYNRLGRHPAETLSVIVEELRIQVPLTHAPAASFATAKLISGSV
jgi:hypothetical protein